MGLFLKYSIFNFRFKFDDKDLNRLIELDDQLVDELGGLGMPEDWMPGLKYVWESPGMRRMKSGLKEVMDTVIGKKYWEHLKSFDRGKVFKDLVGLFGVYVSLDS